jgi:transcription initiation factor TFIID subunit TAF12
MAEEEACGKGHGTTTALQVAHLEQVQRSNLLSNSCLLWHECLAGGSPRGATCSLPTKDWASTSKTARRLTSDFTSLEQVSTCVCVCVCVCERERERERERETDRESHTTNNAGFLRNCSSVYLLYWYKSTNTDAAEERTPRSYPLPLAHASVRSLTNSCAARARTHTHTHTHTHTPHNE